MMIFYIIQMMITIMIHDYDNDIDSGDPKDGVLGQRR